MTAKPTIQEVLESLNIQKGGVRGIVKDAPAQDAYYLRCEHMDYETEETTKHFTNYDEQVKKALNQITAIIKEARPEIPEQKKYEPCVYCGEQYQYCGCVGAVKLFSNQLVLNLKERGISI